MTVVNSRRKQTSPKRRPAKKRQRKISRTQKPEELSLEVWQRELRRQFGREQNFGLENIGDHPVFSEFHVTNPESGGRYRVAIRGVEPGENYCSCSDFSTNTLGTCKHIEFTLSRLERKRGGKRALREGFHPPYSEVYLLYGAHRLVKFRPGEECPVELSRLAARYFDETGELKQNAFFRFHTFLSKAGDIGHDLRCYDDALDLIAQIRDRENRRKKLAKLFPAGIRSAAFRKLLKVQLYDYQREGALFAAEAGRCLIGDEMGLGKTIQAIAAAEIMAREFGIERVLVVCPTSLKHQWEQEIQRFADRSVCVINGSMVKRRKLFNEESFYKIMNYDTVHRDLDAIAELSPDLVILDEAQRIKNWETRTAKSVKKIESPHCIVLTGTPLENRLQELVSIVDFVDQHRLGPTFRFLNDHQVYDENGRVVGYRQLDRIGKTLKPILIRRKKKEVLKQLPDRLEKNFFVPMTPQQLTHHEENRETVGRVVNKWRRFGFLTEADQRRLMIALQNMRMSCDSTYLLDQQSDFGIKPDELLTLLDESFEDSGSKAIIFSQWTRMHELCARRIEGRSWDHVFFHGGVKTPKRKQLVDRFREDPNCRAFLATDAGGVGLNLQHANIVVNLDLPWNPAVLEQRIGRAHRIGQKQPVRVVNFIAEGTIEEGMLSILAFKKSLFAGVLDGGEKEIFLGKSRLKRFMETVEKVTDGISAVDTPTTTETTGEQPSTNIQTEQTETEQTLATVSGTSTADPLSMLLQGGLQLLEQFAATATSNSNQAKTKPARTGVPNIQVDRDETTGESFVKLPVPSPETVDRFLQTMGTLLESIRK